MTSAGPYANNLHLGPDRWLNFYRPDALSDAQPTVSKRWRTLYFVIIFVVIVCTIKSKTIQLLILNTHTRLTALFPGLPRWAGTRKVKPIWILLKQETVSGSGISWAVGLCKSAPCSRQTTTPASHHSVFFTGRMPFLPPNQQHQSTEGKC